MDSRNNRLNFGSVFSAVNRKALNPPSHGCYVSTKPVISLVLWTTTVIFQLYSPKSIVHIAVLCPVSTMLSLTYKVLTTTQPPYDHTFISLSPLNVLAVLALYPLLLLLGHLHHHL